MFGVKCSREQIRTNVFLKLLLCLKSPEKTTAKHNDLANFDNIPTFFLEEKGKLPSNSLERNLFQSCFVLSQSR